MMTFGTAITVDGSASSSGHHREAASPPESCMKEVDQLMIDVIVKVIELATKVVGLVSELCSFLKKNRPGSRKH